MRKTLTTTYLKKINACQEAISAFEAQPERETIKILELLIKRDNFEWFNWLVVRLMNHKQKIKYAIFAAEQVLVIYENKYINDKRPRTAIESAKFFAKNIKPNKAAVIDYTTRAAAAAVDAAAHAAYAAAYAAAAAAAAAAAVVAVDTAATYVVVTAAAAADVDAVAAVDAAAAAVDAAAVLRKKIINYAIKLLGGNIDA